MSFEWALKLSYSSLSRTPAVSDSNQQINAFGYNPEFGLEIDSHTFNAEG